MTNTVWANKKIEIFACYLINFRFRFKFHEKRNNNDKYWEWLQKRETMGLEGAGGREQYDLLNFFEEVNYKKEQKSWKFFCF